MGNVQQGGGSGGSDKVPRVSQTTMSSYDPSGCLVEHTSAHTIDLDTKVFEEYRRFRGKLQYYIFTTDGWVGHRVIVVRDAAHGKRAILYHIQATRRGWVCKIEQTTWRPSAGGSSAGGSITS